METLAITVLPKPDVYTIADETYAPFGLAGLPLLVGFACMVEDSMNNTARDLHQLLK